MKIDLEKYIRHNRGKLDEVESFDVEGMWDDLSEKKAPVKRIKLSYYLVAAAVAILLIGMTIFMTKENKLGPDELVYEKLLELDPALATKQEKMLQSIHRQGVLISQMGINEKKFPELFNELKSLDSLQNDAIQDLDNFRDRKNLMRILLKHYEQKSRVLELMLYEFEKQEKESTYESTKEI